MHFPPTVTLNASRAKNASQNSAQRIMATAAPLRRPREQPRTPPVLHLQLLAVWAPLLEKSQACPWDGRDVLRM